MGWQLSRKDNQYRIYSTISDSWLTDWISREEALAVWYDSALMDFKKKVIEQYLGFPCYWGNHDDHRRTSVFMDEDRHAARAQWLKKLSDTHDEDEYYELVDEMFEKIKAELEVKEDK